MSDPRAQSINSALTALRDARHFARLQAKAAADSGARARWNRQLNLINSAIGELEKAPEAARVGASMPELQDALDKSVKLQSHYAELLNMHDSGSRLTFADADVWMRRLASLRKKAVAS